VPLGCGTTFVRDGSLLGRAFTLEPAAYLEGSAREADAVRSQFDTLGHAFHDFNVEQSARSRGATVWAALKEMGASGMRERVSRHVSFAHRLAERVQASPVLELLAPVSLSICCFRYVPAQLRGAGADLHGLNELNREVLARLHEEHHHVPSSTEINGAFAIRACYINPRTTPEDVDGLADAVERIGAGAWRNAAACPRSR
jgi:glutamate/tyrosine decarboxylase-like PLP-dependent enzyme